MRDNCDMLDVCLKYGFCYDVCYNEETKRAVKGYMGVSIFPPNEQPHQCSMFEKKQLMMLDEICNRLKR